MSTRTTSLRIAHFVNLGQVGGIEAMMLSVAGRLHEPEGSQGIVLTDHLHPHWGAQWPGRQLMTSPLKRWGPWRLPVHLGLQGWRLRALLRQYGPFDAALLWGLCLEPQNFRALRAAGVPVVYMEHGSSSRAHRRGKLERGLSYPDLITANSQATRRLLEAVWGAEQAIVTLPNPLRPEAAPETSQAPRPRAPDEPLRLGLVGRLAPIKGAALAIHALHILRQRGVEAELELAGDGWERMRLAAIVQRLGLEAAVHFHGNLQDIASFYTGIDLLLCPSLRESFGLASLEAQAWAVPVIAARIEGLPETLQDGETGTLVTPTLAGEALRGWDVDPDTLPARVYRPMSHDIGPPQGVAPEALASAIQGYADNEPLRQQHGRAASAWALNHFSMDAYVQRLDATLRRVIGT